MELLVFVVSIDFFIFLFYYLLLLHGVGVLCYSTNYKLKLGFAVLPTTNMYCAVGTT